MGDKSHPPVYAYMAPVVCSSWGITGLVAVYMNSSDWSVSEIPTSKYLSTYSFFLSAFSNSSPKNETLACPHLLGKKIFYSSSLGSVLESF